jgi:hypothetical protein
MAERDDALLWAREKLSEQWRDQDGAIASEYRAGNMDAYCQELRDLVTGYRAGQASMQAKLDARDAENARLREALSDIDRRCAAWASSSPNRSLVGAKPGTIRNVGAIARAALASVQP